MIPISHSSIVESTPSIDFQKQHQDLKEKLEQRINELHSKENECVTLKAKVDTYESKEKDLQHYISILKESILIKDQQVNMIQSEVRTLPIRCFPSLENLFLDHRSSNTIERKRCDYRKEK